jgi:hypothetical protein
MKTVNPVVCVLISLLIYNLILVPRLFDDSSGSLGRIVGAGIAGGLGVGIGRLIVILIAKVGK